MKARRGSKKAIVAIAHRILKAIYFMIKHGKRFEDPGEEYLEERVKKNKLIHVMKQAQALGFELKPAS